MQQISDQVKQQLRGYATAEKAEGKKGWFSGKSVTEEQVEGNKKVVQGLKSQFKEAVPFKGADCRISKRRDNQSGYCAACAYCGKWIY